MACSNLPIIKHRDYPFLLSLEIGFRHFDPKTLQIEAELIYGEHNQELAIIVFKSKDGEAIADLLHAWTSESSSHAPYSSLKVCAEHLIGLHNLQPFSPRLQHHIITTVELIGYQPFEQVGLGRFIELLNILDVQVEDIRSSYKWAKLLLDVIQSPAQIQHLSHSYWEWLIRLAAFWSPELADGTTYNPHTIGSLGDNGEWDRLKCWLCVVWMVWPPKSDQTIEDLEHVMLSLCHQRPGAIQELEENLEKYSWPWTGIPESFQQICKKVHNEAAQQATL